MSIEVKNISKSYPGNKVLDNISLVAQEGQILGLIGPSGAGKTTLIRLITGAIKADDGEIFIGGIKVPDRRLLKTMGYMPQSEGLYTDLTGFDNMFFYARLYGLKGKVMVDRCRNLLEFISLEKDANKLVSEYSFGMRKRLSLIIALIHEPKYLFLDEPTVGIDPRLRLKIWGLFDKLLAEGKSLILSTHVMDEAERCESCALIQDGHLLAYGKTKSLLAGTKSGSLEELFLVGQGGGF